MRTPGSPPATFLIKMPPATRSTLDRHPGDQSAHPHWLAEFTRLAASEPNRIAVISGSHSIRFGELETRSNQIARLLEESGTKTGDFVGVAFHRSVELVAALLGILKTGAAYVPIDPGYPAARISQMISSAGLDTIVTSKEHATRFPDIRVLCTDPDAIDRFSGESMAFGSMYRHPVYAIFTSGSTGEPKAASVSHSGFANLLEWYRTELALGRDDRTLVISSPSFDLTQKNLFTPLLTGGTLVLDDCLTYDITRILGLVRKYAITLINCTPSAFYPLVDAAATDDFDALKSLRFAVLGGEPVSTPRLRPWLENPDSRAVVVNTYGPTECTDICLFHRLDRGNLDEFPFIPLGREIPNVSVSIRDANLARVADGETGELCISGAGVGGGYLHDPARTADRFVTSETAIYRSGDLAKRLPCGKFEFRGRADHQVKVNGFRIEIGEIETALGQHGEVREAVVVTDGSRLVAHIQGTAKPAALREHLGSRLPEYMIPDEFLFLNAYPLTPNGKIDRSALACTRNQQAVRGNGGTDMENRILHLWSTILGHSVTDPCANFSDLGGSSIHIAVVHVRLREMTGIDFPITDLFARPSARSIASHLSPKPQTSVTTRVQDRARLARAGFTRFQSNRNQ